ncbi:MAG: hypothetical protein ACUVV0_04970 [Anaerolineae bacterium]
MQTVTISQIMENLRKLPADKLVVVYDFVSYLVERETGQVAQQGIRGEEPIAVILSMAEYERLIARWRRKAAFHDFARNLGREVEKSGLSEEKFMADLEETKREVFAEQYGQSA